MMQPVALGVVAIAQPDVARRHLDPPQVLAHASCRQLAIDSAPQSRIVTVVQSPVGAVAAGPGDRRAVDQADDPAFRYRRAAQTARQQAAYDLLQPDRAAAQAIESRHVRQLAQTYRLRPRRHSTQRHAARPVSQRQTQQIFRTLDLATANQRSAGLRRRFQFLCRAQPAQQLSPTAIQL
jgi:hypothetical protein